MVSEAKRRAKSKGLPFNLATDDIVAPVEAGLCELSNIPLNFAPGQRTAFSPSLHRIDPEQGYVVGNVLVVCWAINNMISDFGQGTFETIAYRHLMHARPDLVIAPQRRRQAHNDNRQLDMFAETARWKA